MRNVKLREAYLASFERDFFTYFSLDKWFVLGEKALYKLRVAFSLIQVFITKTRIIREFW